MIYEENGIRIIDTSDEDKNQNFYNDLEYDKLDFDPHSATANDFCLVRITDIFPTDKELHILDNTNNPVKDSNFLSNSLVEILTRKKYGETYQDILNSGQFMSREEEANTILEFERKVADEFADHVTFGYRTTKHFSLNGLVASHMMGDFEDRNYIILEPLEEHINDPRLISLAENDTYFKLEKDDPLKLSEEAIILISEEKYNADIEDEKMKEQLEKFKTVLYRGDGKVATDVLLSELGYLSEDIGKHGYRTDSLMDKAVSVLQETYGIGYIQDFASKHNLEDKEVMFKERQKDLANFNKRFVHEFGEKYNITLEEIEDMDNFNSPNRDENQKRIKDLIEDIGLEKVLTFIQEFNEDQIKKMNIRNERKENIEREDNRLNL